MATGGPAAGAAAETPGRPLEDPWQASDVDPAKPGRVLPGASREETGKAPAREAIAQVEAGMGR